MKKNLLTSWTYIRRSPYQALTAMFALFLAFLLGGIFALISYISVATLRYFESKPQIIVFFNDKVTDQEVNNLKTKIEETGKVKSVKYISKEDALLIYQEQNKKDPLLLELVTADILPASLEISALEPQYLTQLEPVLAGAEGVEEVVYQKDVVESLIKWTKGIRSVGGLLALLLALNAILITVTVISMKIAMRKDEIEVLKLIGATPWFIRLPFIFEGVFYGLIGAFMACLVIVAILIWLQPILANYLSIIPTLEPYLKGIFTTPFALALLVIVASLLLFGFFMGSIGSLLALAHYLKL